MRQLYTELELRERHWQEQRTEIQGQYQQQWLGWEHSAHQFQEQARDTNQVELAQQRNRLQQHHDSQMAEASKTLDGAKQFADHALQQQREELLQEAEDAIKRQKIK